MGLLRMCVCVCVLRMAGRLAQIYHFVVAFLPDITVLPLFSKTLKHFVCPNVQTHAREKEDLGSVENQHKTMSLFSLRIALADPRGLLDKQVFRWTSQRGHLSPVCSTR